MPYAELTRVILILSHLIVFAAALFLVMREDLRLMKAERLEVADLKQTAHGVSLALMGLFATGATIVWFDTGFDPAVMADKPKLLAKFTVVAVLTLNGLALHHLLMPMLERAAFIRVRPVSRFAAVLGAISSVSWLFATFLGVAKPLTDVFGYQGFMMLYITLLIGGITVALAAIAPHVERLILATRRGEPFDRLVAPVPVPVPVRGPLRPPVGQPGAQLREALAVDIRKSNAHRPRA